MTYVKGKMNYVTIEKELLELVFAFDNFNSYLVGSEIIVYTNQVNTKYLFNKKDIK